jgi:hypothetical protein
MFKDKRIGLAAILAIAFAAAACGEGHEGGEGRDDDEDGIAGPSAAASPTPQAPNPTPTPAAAPGASIAYVQDIKPILEADCLRCHGNLASYGGVMAFVTPGSASSLLVRVTQPGGSMNSRLSGDRTRKADLIRRWVVDNGAAQSR